MVRSAKSYHPHNDIRQLNILDMSGINQFDIVTANGIFYLLGEEAEARMWEIVVRMIELARVAVAFNSLSSWAPDPEPNEFYADPADVIRKVQKFSSKIIMRHDYHSRDFTVYIYK
jgi:hypothetical protein